MSLLGTTNPFGKDIWLPGCYDQLEQTPGLFWAMLDATEPVRMEGRNAFFKVEIGDSLGGGVIADGGDFFDPSDPSYAEATLAMAHITHTAGLTFGEWQLLNSNAAAAVPVVERKLAKAVQKITRDLARMTLGDGTAKLARCAVTTASLTVNLQSVDGTSGSANQYDRDRFNWLAPRRSIVDIVDATTGAAITNGAGRTIVSVSKSGNTIVLDTAGGVVTTTTSHLIVWRGSTIPFSLAAAGAYTSGEFQGINQILKTSRSYLGINSATAGNDYWDPVRVVGAVSGTNESISLDRILKLYNGMAQTAEDGMQPTNEKGYCLFSNFGVSAAAIELLAPGIRYAEPQAGDVADFAWRRVEGLGIQWYTDVHYPHNVLDCLHKPSLKKVKPQNELQDILDFLTLDSGGIWHLQNAAVGNGHAAAARAYLYGMFGIMTYRPNAHGRLDDVRELGV